MKELVFKMNFGKHGSFFTERTSLLNYNFTERTSFFNYTILLNK